MKMPVMMHVCCAILLPMHHALTSCASLRKYSLPLSLKLAAVPPGRSAAAYSSLQACWAHKPCVNKLTLTAHNVYYLEGLHMQSTSWSHSPVMFIPQDRRATVLDG